MSNVKGPDNAPDRNQRLEQLVDRYQEQVMRMCFLYLCDKTLAEDAMQENMLTKRWPKITPSSPSK